MVAISKLINGGLTLAGQSVFEQLATPQQSSMEQFNIARYLAGAGPYIQNPGFGILTDIPDQCTVEQVQLLSRHGERYPTKGDGKQFDGILAKLNLLKGTFKGEWAFYNEYTYFVQDTLNYEKETTPKNSQGLYSGTDNALRHGAKFRAKYNSLFLEKQVLPVFTSNSGRVAETSRYFARGFLGDEYDSNSVKYVILEEESFMGANSLTPRYGCKNFDEKQNKDIYSKYSDDYLKGALKRWQKTNPKLNLTTDDISKLFAFCSYELNVRGLSPFCDLFTNEEFVKYSYGSDLKSYYTDGPGNNMTLTVAAPLWNASLALLKDANNSNKVWLSFSHDTDLEIFYSVKFNRDDSSMPVDHIPFPHGYYHTNIVPQGARIVIEKYKCDDKSYVRFIVNDAVIPLDNCNSGPGFSCELSDYEKYVHSRIENHNYAQYCGNPDVPSEVTFYWDYNQKNYTASFLDQ